MEALSRTLARLQWFAAVLALVPLAVSAQVATEATVKAAFLHKFAGYVEWPANAFPSPDTPVVIGIAGSEEVAAELEKLVPGRNVNGRSVIVRRVRDADAMRGVHILFVGRGEGGARVLTRAAHQHGALMVTEVERGLELGAVINFVPAEDRISFEVSLDSAERSGLRISSRMLTVARRVVPRS
ncbi:MAG: YfiR family protein [Pseudomonadota bacterium]|nr:YfiR family protein [Pseudomonadota bacterium]